MSQALSSFIKASLKRRPEQPFEMSSVRLKVFLSSCQRMQGGRGQHPPSQLCHRDVTCILVSTALVTPGSPPTAVAFPFGERRDTVKRSKRCSSPLPAPALHQQLLAEPRHHREIPFFRCSLRRELMSEDLPTLGTPITRMLYSVLWKQGGCGQGAAGYRPPTPGATGRCNSPAFAGVSGTRASSLVPPAGEGGDLQMSAVSLPHLTSALW